MIPGRPEVVDFDDYGFAIFAEGSLHASDDRRCHDYSVAEQSFCDMNSLQAMWKKMERSFDQNCSVSPQKLRIFIKKGIPPALRGEFWQLLVGSKLLKNNTTFVYEDKLSEVRKILVDCGVTEYDGKSTAMTIGTLVGSYEADETISIERPPLDDVVRNQLTSFRQALLDADRTFPTHKMFMEGTNFGKEGRAALFRILAVYILYNPQVSYCQGMSYIGGMLLTQMSEEDAFWMLVSLIERPKYLSGYFDSTLSKIQRHSQVFEKLLSQKMPRLSKHLKENGIDSLLYITPWFMALFTSLPCWDSVLTIWDLLLLDGISVIFQASLGILRTIYDELLSRTGISQILPILLRLPSERLKRSYFVPVMWRWTIYSWEVDAVLAIITDTNNVQSNQEAKRKLLHEENCRERKIPRLAKDAAVTNEQSSSLSLFQKVTKFVGSFWSSLSKENKPLDTNTTVDDKNTGHKQDSFVSKSRILSARHRGRNRCSPRQRIERNPITNDDGRMLQQLNVTSSVRRSPRIARLHSPKGGNKTPTTSNEWVSSSPKARHAFKMFNTPTPMRITKINGMPRHLKNLDFPTPPQFSLSPDVELRDMQNLEEQLTFR